MTTRVAQPSSEVAQSTKSKVNLIMYHRFLRSHVCVDTNMLAIGCAPSYSPSTARDGALVRQSGAAAATLTRGWIGVKVVAPIIDMKRPASANASQVASALPPRPGAVSCPTPARDTGVLLGRSRPVCY